MRCNTSVVCLPFLLLPGAVAAQKPTPAPPQPLNKTVQAAALPPALDYKDEAGVFEHYDTLVRMHADGTGERIDHVVLRVQSEGAVRALVYSRCRSPRPAATVPSSTW